MCLELYWLKLCDVLIKQLQWNTKLKHPWVNIVSKEDTKEKEKEKEKEREKEKEGKDDCKSLQK